MIFRSVLIVILAVAVGAVVWSLREDDRAVAPGGETATPTGPTPPFGRGPIAAGLHDFAIFDPRVSLVFGDGWSSVFPPDEDEIAFEGPVFLAISRASMVVDPETGEFVPLPEDLIAWVGTHRNFDASPPVETKLGNQPAFMIDATAREATKTLGFSAADAILVAAGDRMRVIVADVNGKIVAATMIASPEEFDSAVAAGQALLDTLRFEVDA